MATSNNGQADAPFISATWDCPLALATYVAFGKSIDERESEIAFLARTVEMAQRLATIRAIGIRPDAPRITVADMEWGRDLALWSATRMMAETADHLADTVHQAEAQRVMRMIKERGRIKHRDLVRALGQRTKERELKETLDGLANAGQIIVEKTIPTGGGTPSVWYSAT